MIRACQECGKNFPFRSNKRFCCTLCGDRARRATDPEKYTNRRRVYYAANKDRAKKNGRAWRAANREKSRENLRAWHAAHPGWAAEKSRSMRADARKYRMLMKLTQQGEIK